jgi:hypothetical protein
VKSSIILTIFSQLQVAKEAFGEPSFPLAQLVSGVDWQKVDIDTMMNLKKEGFRDLVRNHDILFQFDFYNSVG